MRIGHVGTRQQDGVEFAVEFLRRDIHPDVGVHLEPNPLLPQQVQPAVQDSLLHLEFWDPVPKQSADPVVPLEDRNPVAGPVELLRRRQASRAGAHHHHLLSGADQRRFWLHPSLLEGVVNDGQLDGPDRHGVIVNPQDTRAFTGGRAERSRKLREVVRGVQPITGPSPAVSVH